MRATRRIDEALVRVKGMFLELPGSRVSPQEAARLAGLDIDICTAVLEALVDVRFLKRCEGDTFVRSGP